MLAAMHLIVQQAVYWQRLLGCCNVVKISKTVLPQHSGCAAGAL
jgi:hypothetical protein